MGELSVITDGQSIACRIHLIRGQKVLLDSSLAELYGVPTKRFNERVKSNADRFPADFMFQPTEEEHSALRSQNATLKTGRGQHRKYLPYAFTEHGAIMAATILNSPRAIEMSVFVVRAFVQLREMLSVHKDLAARLDALEQKYDARFKVVFDAIRQLMIPPEKEKRGIGFMADISGKEGNE
ncbi:ORF6N domain-containing protein [Azovibrio restrictus]|uniref:ORF6N domain-containing protein n=1 Tax=Azovibrio restrictus TaxID=146938 RepID=UPI0026EA1A7B|nr:ORF6N domain-containing protein [Azovibrio restrictus]